MALPKSINVDGTECVLFPVKELGDLAWDYEVLREIVSAHRRGSTVSRSELERLCKDFRQVNLAGEDDE